MKIGMPAILIFRSTKHLTFIVSLHFTGSGQDDGTIHQMQVDTALEVDAATKIGAGRHPYLSSATGHASIDGTVDGQMVKCPPISFGAIVTHVIHSVCIHGDTECHAQQNRHHSMSHIHYLIIYFLFKKEQMCSFFP